jgi:hypothetical protein
MKLIRFGAQGKEIGVQIDGVNYDVSAFGGDYNEQFFAEDGVARLEEFVKANEGKLIEVPQGERIGAPFARHPKLFVLD